MYQGIVGCTPTKSTNVPLWEIQKKALFIVAIYGSNNPQVNQILGFIIQVRQSYSRPQAIPRWKRGLLLMVQKSGQPLGMYKEPYE